MEAAALLTRFMATRRDEVAPNETTDRILDAALKQVELFGIRRTTMEDVARRAGVSRVTLYRHFPTKDALVESAIIRAARDLLIELGAVVDRCARTEDKIVEAVVHIVGVLRGHALLRQLLHGEPEQFLPQLTTEAGPLLAFARQLVVSYLRSNNWLELEEEDLEVAAETAIRLTLSLVLTPESVVDLDDPEALRRLIRRYVVPFTDPEIIARIKRQASQRDAPKGTR